MRLPVPGLFRLRVRLHELPDELEPPQLTTAVHLLLRLPRYGIDGVHPVRAEVRLVHDVHLELRLLPRQQPQQQPSVLHLVLNLL